MNSCFFCNAECPYSGIDGYWGEDCLYDGPIQSEDIGYCEDVDDSDDGLTLF